MKSLEKIKKKSFYEIRAKVQTGTNDALNENEISAIKKSGFRGHVDISYKRSESLALCLFNSTLRQ